MLYRTDSTGAMYRALGFSPGFAPDAQVSPYLKLLPMLMGIGSPGTIQEVESQLSPHHLLLYLHDCTNDIIICIMTLTRHAYHALF